MSKSEHQVSCRDTTLRHNPEDLDLNLHRREKKKKMKFRNISQV